MYVLGLCVHVVAAGLEVQGLPLWEGRHQGLRCARHSQFQLFLAGSNSPTAGCS